MQRKDLDDLQVFRTVAQASSFTRAAAQLGMSASAASQVIRNLEARLGVKLLTRTTRNVSATQAGSSVLAEIGPAFDRIQTALEALNELRDAPSGTVRITAGEHAAATVIWPAIVGFVKAYPNIKIELDIDDTLLDLATGRYDTGVRLGEQVAKDMVAVRIGPDLRMAVVGAPDYLAEHPAPESPKDLMRHTCINLRLPTHDALYAWELEKGDKKLRVHVDGPLVFTRTEFILKAAVSGAGLACLFEDQVQSYLANGSLLRVLGDWCPPFPGYHLYYPSNRQPSLGFKLLVDQLRYRIERSSISS